MVKRVGIVIVALGVVLAVSGGIPPVTYGQMPAATSDEHHSHGAGGKATATGSGHKADGEVQKHCPVSGEEIDEKSKVIYEYEGKTYEFCCPGCAEQFKKDPERYIQKINREEKQ